MSVAASRFSIDFNARFGEPRIRRYTVDDRLRLSVEYRAQGRISAIEIAPAKYRGSDPSQPLEMLSETANRILERLFPRITASGLVSATTVESAYPGFSREVRTLPAISLIRDYPLGDDRSRMIYAAVEVISADSGSTASEVISTLGAPEYQQFAAGSGLAVGVCQLSQGSLRQIVISAEESLLARASCARAIEREAAEKLLAELLPSSSGVSEIWSSVFRSGAYKRERVQSAEFLLCRDYVNDDMTAIRIGWPAAGFDEQPSC